MLIVFLIHFLLPYHQAKQVNISNCYELKLRKNEFFFTSFDTIFLESKDSNFSMLQLQNKILIETQIIQHYPNQNAIILPNFIFKKDDNNLNLIQQFCWLNKNTTAQYITCKKRMHKYLVDNQIIFGTEVITEIKYPSNENYICEDLFINEIKVINIFCFSNSNIYIISMNLDTSYTYNIIQQTNINSCSRKILKTIQEDQFIIGYTKCKDWSVNFYKGFSIQNIIDINNLTNHDNFTQNDKLTNIQLCQKNLYLIFRNQYLVINIESVSTQSIFLFGEQHQIFTLIFDNTCSIYSQVFISETTSKQISVFNNSVYVSITQIPQNIYHFKNLLIFQYSSIVSVMINQRIIQNYQLKLSTLKYDKINNLLYGYDYIQNSIKFFKLQNQLGYFQYNNYKYLLQIQAQSLLFKENYDIISCLQIVEQDNSQFQGYIIGKRLDYGLSCFSENYISLQFSKFHIQSNEPIIVKVAPNSRIEAISDRKELEQICQPKIKGYNLKDSSYFLTYYNKGFHSQQVVWKNDQKYIFQSCRGEQLQQSLVQNQEQTQVFYYIGTIVLVFLELQEVKIFDFQQSLNSYKIIKLPEKISQINQFDDQIVFQPEDSNHIFLLNLSQLQYLLEKFEKQLNETQVLYFKKRASKFVIQYEKHLYIIFQETHSVFSFQDHQIIYSQFEKSSIVFYAIDQLQNKIIQYQYRDQNLIFQECLNLNEYHYQIYIPLTVSCNYGRIIIATKNQSGQFFLFIINLKEMLTYNLDKIIEIGRLEFFSTPQYLYFYDKEKKIQIYQFDYLNFTVNIQDIDQYQNILTINESLIFQSQIQTFPQLNQYIALQFSNYCQKIKKLSASQQILYSKQQSSIQLSFQEYFTGPIYKLKLLNTSNLELHGPFLNRQQLQKCNNPLDQTSCFQIRTIKYQGNTTLYIYLIYLENEYKILKIVNNNYLLFRFIPISQMYLLENDQLIIIIHHQDLCIFQFYEFNQLNSMYLEQSIQNYECMEFPISQCKKEGNLIMLRIQQSIRLFLIHEQQVTELHFEFQDQYDDFFILNNTPNQFLLMKNYQDIQFCLISIYYLDQNQLHFNSSYKLDQQKFQFELLQYELESQILFSDTQIFYKSFKIEQQQIISKIIIFSKKTIFIGLVECQILQKECIYSVSRTLKTPDYSTYEKHQKFDEDFIYLLINQNYYLFDLTIKNSINHIAAFSEKNYEISKFNTTHYLFNSIKQSQDIFIGQIGYEIEILEAGQKQKEIEFNLFAQNEISEEQISLILFNDDLNISIQITKTYLIYLLIMIFIIFMIYFIRRSKLKLQNQVNKTNDQL